MPAALDGLRVLVQRLHGYVSRTLVPRKKRDKEQSLTWALWAAMQRSEPTILHTGLKRQEARLLASSSTYVAIATVSNDIGFAARMIDRAVEVMRLARAAVVANDDG